jgi:type VI secretion system secreted protein Hcp
MAVVDYFLKIDGLESESLDEKHKGEIELESWSWGETNSGSMTQAGGGGGAGKVAHQDLHFVKKVDKTSPVLAISCATGKHFKFMTLTSRKAGGKQEDYLVVKLEEALISSYQIGGSAHGDVIPTEQVSINFAKLAYSYKPQKSDGTLGPAIDQKYDYAANKAG